MSERLMFGHEKLDEPEIWQGHRKFARASYATMAASSRYMGSIRSIRRFVKKEFMQFSPSRPLRVLDIGAGVCNVAESVVRWARKKSMPIKFTCIDNKPYAVELARRRFFRNPIPGISVRCESIEDHSPNRSYDCAIGSLFFHHLTNGQILRLFNHLRKIVRSSVFINDLRRCSTAFIGFLALYPVLHTDVWHDGLMSIRRGFSAPELRDILQQLPYVSVQTQNEALFRVTGLLRFLG